MESLLNRSIITSAQYDPAKAGVGGSACVGDQSSTGIVVPQFSTTQQNRRYQFRLCGINVPTRMVCVIRQIKQLLYIGTDLETEPGEPGDQWHLEVPVTDPMWSFPDGNVSWHLTTSTPRKPDTTIFTDTFVSMNGYSTRGDVSDCALLARAPAVGAGTYRPLNGGAIYGNPVAGLGTFRDMRYPWNGRDTYLGIQIPGPCLLTFFASVYQTDPDRRPNKPVGIETAGLRQEDLFVLNYPQARYTRVGARIEVDMISLEEAKRSR